MKTAEEILKEATKRTLNINEGSPLHDAVMKAMEEYAQQQVKNCSIPQPIEIEKLMKEKLEHRMINDDLGWTGEWRMSAKDVLDVIIDLQKMNKYKEAIPGLTKEWIEKGNTILDEKYRGLWAKCVPIRLGDLYQGMELGSCLEIVEQLNNGKTVEEVKPLIENQGHSGMSFELVCSMVKSFCDRGEEFVNYVRS